MSSQGAASAELLTYAISGTVTAITDDSTDHYVPTSVVHGSTFAGTISFDNAAFGSFSGGGGYYRGTALDLQRRLFDRWPIRMHRHHAFDFG